jgi:hypothetical protein
MGSRAHVGGYVIMARHKNTGAAISFRLPTEPENLDRAFRAMAKAEGLSPGEYARKLILF